MAWSVYKIQAQFSRSGKITSLKFSQVNSQSRDVSAVKGASIPGFSSVIKATGLAPSRAPGPPPFQTVLGHVGANCLPGNEEMGNLTYRPCVRNRSQHSEILKLSKLREYSINFK
jgi:hypothetical protein